MAHIEIPLDVDSALATSYMEKIKTALPDDCRKQELKLALVGMLNQVEKMDLPPAAWAGLEPNGVKGRSTKEDGQSEEEYLKNANTDVMVCKVVSQLKVIDMKLYSEGTIYTGTATYDVDTFDQDWKWSGDEPPDDIAIEISAVISDTAVKGSLDEEITWESRN